MTIKLKMIPQPQNFHQEGFGIHRVVEAYFRYLPQYDVELVPINAKRYDIKAAHAGMTDGDCDVAHLHGIYFTADYPATDWEFKANANIVNALHHAKQVTVPSKWVTETFQRDMRFTPHVVPHGIEWQEWQHSEQSEGYVLWNKGRKFDVCNPDSMGQLSLAFPQVQFLSTFMPKRGGTNIIELGTVPHKEMKKLVQKAGVYLSTTKETFGLGVLEAMVSGVPVLGWRYGGNVDLVQHGMNGYLATPGNMEDLKEGLIYCLRHRKTLGDNGREMAKEWTWQKACEKLVEVYRLAMEDEPATVSVVIPVYNKPQEQVFRAIESCLNQTLKPTDIIIVNDGSSDEYWPMVKHYDGTIEINQNNSGVAVARNRGVSETNSKYICCLDADDWIEPLFLERCVNALEDDNSLGIAYTSIQWHGKDGKTGISEWPGDWNFDKQVNYKGRQNQVPTCCVFKREMWERLGGYRQRYAPDGAGAEDAEFWARAGTYGYRAEKVTAEPLFNYSFGGQVSGNSDYQEVDWLAWHPWAQDKDHPLASYAKPKNNLLSHPVRQYDEPVVSVIIPVGPGHEKEVINALDSLEAQTFRKWEAIVADDSGQITTSNDPKSGWLAKIYPYIRFVHSDQEGAGYARNRGAEIARGHFLLFLDADDILLPTCLERMLEEYSIHPSAIYTDHYGTAIVSPELAQQTKNEGRLEYYNEKTGLMMMRRSAFDYDCKRAQSQPTHIGDVYIWNNITTLIPKSWHFEIGGFDENMETWEDWDYWLRIAKTGKCFSRIPEFLMTYRYYTGERRNKAAADTLEGRQLAQNMLEYIRKKDIEIMPGCSNCPGGKRQPPPAPQRNVAMSTSGEEFVRAEYVGGRGNRHVLGAFVFSEPIPGRSMKRRNNGYVMDYGYFSAGRIVDAVHVEDIRLMVHKWKELPKVVLPEEIIEPPSIPEPLIPPEPMGFDLQTIPGITPKIAQQMRDLGLDTKEAILEAGIDELIDIKGVAEARAKIILKEAEK